MSREDGFAIADLDVALMSDPKIVALGRRLRDPTQTAAHVGLYVALILESWHAGKRLTLEAAAPAWWLADLTEAQADLAAVGLVDEQGQILEHAWSSWFGAASARREAIRDRWRRNKSAGRTGPESESPRGVSAESARKPLRTPKTRAPASCYPFRTVPIPIRHWRAQARERRAIDAAAAARPRLTATRFATTPAATSISRSHARVTSLRRPQREPAASGAAPSGPRRRAGAGARGPAFGFEDRAVGCDRRCDRAGGGGLEIGLSERSSSPALAAGRAASRAGTGRPADRSRPGPMAAAGCTARCPRRSPRDAPSWQPAAAVDRRSAGPRSSWPPGPGARSPSA